MDEIHAILKAVRDGSRDFIRTRCSSNVIRACNVAAIKRASNLESRWFSAYTSWIRFYSSYPRDMREIFDRRTVHLGHYAKSFALRETPQRIGGIGKKLHEKDSSKQQHNNRLTNEK